MPLVVPPTPSATVKPKLSLLCQITKVNLVGAAYKFRPGDIEARNLRIGVSGSVGGQLSGGVAVEKEDFSVCAAIGAASAIPNGIRTRNLRTEVLGTVVQSLVAPRLLYTRLPPSISAWVNVPPALRRSPFSLSSPASGKRVRM